MAQCHRVKSPPIGWIPTRCNDSDPTSCDGSSVDGKPAQLFNLDGDPRETTNRLDDEPEIASQMKAALANIIRRDAAAAAPVSDNVTKPRNQ